MKVLTGALLPLLGPVSVLATALLSSVPGQVISNRFIVELSSPHEALYQSLRVRGVGFHVDNEFNAQSIFVGVALTLPNAQDVAKLQEIPGVVAIRPVTIFAAPKPVKSHVLSGPSDPQLPPDTESTHIITGVKQLHAQGIIGEHVRIGIIDTGIDYLHPLLGGGFGLGYKIEGGTDMVGDKFDGSNTPVPDADPMDCFGHGTQVAGVLGANPGNIFNISGVAYGATLSAYRIFGCEGATTDDLIIKALLLGLEDGQDILTLSIGESIDWTGSSTAVVASRIAATGTVVTMAAGNDGLAGSWYTDAPGNGIGGISVASVDNDVVPAQSATVNGVAHAPIIYFSLFPFPIAGDLPIFALSTDVTLPDVGCKPLPDTTPDLSPFLVIVRRGKCSDFQKILNIAAKEAKVIFIYDNGQGPAFINIDNFSAAIISEADGQFLVSQFAAKAKITVSFPQAARVTVQINEPYAWLVSNLSSYGPTTDLFFKPSIAAPGGNIVTTYPVHLGNFTITSGTSMATPFIAGCAALLFSVKGRSSDVGKGALTLFETTAQRIPSSHTDGDPLQTLAKQGAGLVNVYNAIHTTTIVSPGEFLLNDTDHFRGEQSFTVHNTGLTAQTFNLSHVPAGTALTVTPGSIFVASGPVPLSTQYATVKFSETSFTVQPGQTYELVASFSPPKGVDPSLLPVFSGFVQIKSSTESLQISYMGLAAALKDKQVLDNTNTFFNTPLPVILDPSGKAQLGARTYSFVGNDFPTLLFRLAFGTPLLRADLVDHDVKVATTLNTHDSPAQLISFPDRGRGSFAKVKIQGPLKELDYRSRDLNGNNLSIAFNEAKFVNGTQISNGSYRLLLRALKVFGDPTNEEDFESFLSPIVNISVGN